MHLSSRLGLQIPDSTDAVSGFPPVNAEQMGLLDNAATFVEGTLASRTNPSYHGQLYKATDTGGETLTWFDGSVWLPLGLILATPLVAAATVLVRMAYVEDVLGDR